MTFTLGVKDIHFIKYLFKYLSFFLITPWYNFEEKKVIRPVLCKLYGCLLIVLKVVWIIHTVTDQHLYDFYQQMLFSQKFIFSAVILNMITLNIVTIVKSICDGENWKLLLTNFEHIDEQLRNRGKKEASILKNFYLHFFIKNVVFLMMVAYQLYVWSTVSGLPVLKIACMSCIKEIYYEFLTICLLSAIVQSFKSRYKDLNRKIVNLTKGAKIRGELLAIKHEYRILGTNIEIFNKIFGYQIVFIIFHCALELVNCLNVAFLSHMAEGFHTQVFVAGLSILICVFYNFLHIVLPIDSTTQEAEKFLLLACQVQENFVDDPSEFEEFIKLINCSKDFVPKFSAAGFFQINKGLIFSVVANVATYFIITIQLNEANIGYLVPKK